MAESGFPVTDLSPGIDFSQELRTMGCLVLAQEALSEELLEDIEDALRGQPVWSEPPIIVVAEAAMGLKVREIVKARWHPAKTIFQDRPLKVNEFRSAIQFAVTSRLRQFQIRDRIAQEEELRRELNHRVKNILATVQSVASMTRRMSSSQDDAFDQFMARLDALASVHSTLHGMTEERADFEALVAEISKPYRSSSTMIFARGPALPLQPQSATFLGLCLYELITNATKYGALSVPSGRVEIALEETPRGAKLTWVERGGPPARSPGRSGYGSRFVSLSLGSVFGEPPNVTYGTAGFALSVEGSARELFDQASRESRSISAEH